MTELNTLKRKDPADLWREDLASFSEELEVRASEGEPPVAARLWPPDSPPLPPLFPQSLEAKEKELGSTVVVKKGKGKAVKVKDETQPTPQGRRVIPRVTSTMKAEANRKADVKKGEGKRGRKVKVEGQKTDRKDPIHSEHAPQ